MSSADRVHVKPKNRRGLWVAAGAALLIVALAWGLAHWRFGEPLALQDRAETVSLTSGGELRGMPDVTDAADRAAVRQAFAEKRLPMPATLAELQQPAAPPASASPGVPAI